MIKSFAKYVADTCGVVAPIKHCCVHDNNDGITNPSIIKYNGKTLMSFRSPSYTFVVFRINDVYNRNISYYPQNMPELAPVSNMSYNYLCGFDTDKMEITDSKLFLTDLNDKRDVQFRGNEDIRMYTDGVDLFCTSSVFESWNKIDMKISRFNSDYKLLEEKNYNIRGVEKNWMPVLDRCGVFVHTTPGVVVDVNSPDMFIRNDSMDMVYNGSTQLHPYKDGYVSVCHKRVTCDFVKFLKWGYLHKFIYWNKDLEMVSESDWFSFMGFPIEFTCGIMIENDEVILPFSVFDTTSFVMKFHVSLLDSLLHKGEIEKHDYKTNAFNDILKSNNEDDVCSAVCSYIIHANDNAAARICCSSYLASITNRKTALDLYTRCLCELGRLDMRVEGSYPQVLVMQDMIVRQIKDLIS